MIELGVYIYIHNYVYIYICTRLYEYHVPSQSYIIILYSSSTANHEFYASRWGPEIWRYQPVDHWNHGESSTRCIFGLVWYNPDLIWIDSMPTSAFQRFRIELTWSYKAGQVTWSLHLDTPYRGIEEKRRRISAYAWLWRGQSNKQNKQNKQHHTRGFQHQTWGFNHQPKKLMIQLQNMKLVTSERTIEDVDPHTAKSGRGRKWKPTPEIKHSNYVIYTCILHI